MTTDLDRRRKAATGGTPWREVVRRWVPRPRRPAEEDGRRFDALARSLAEEVPRREAMRRLGVGLTTAVLASLGLESAWGGPGAPNGPKRPKCAKGQIVCGTICCPVGYFCVNGACSSCPNGYFNCNGTCCPNGNSCCNGLACCPVTQSCCDNGACCGAGQDCCSGRCADLTTTQNCGRCGNTCSFTQQSRPQCCSGNCADTNFDEQNCGGCGIPCGSADCCHGTCCPSDKPVCIGAMGSTPDKVSYGCCPTGGGECTVIGEF